MKMLIDSEIKHLKQLTKLLSTSPITKANEKLQERLLSLLNPPGGVEDLELTDMIDLELLQVLQDNFSDAYGVSSVICDKDGLPLTKPSKLSKFCELARTSQKGLRLCRESRTCFRNVNGCTGVAGLTECKNFPKLLGTCVLFMVEGHCVGSWCIGQMVVKPFGEDIVRVYAEKLGVDSDKLFEYSKLLRMETVANYKKLISFLDSMCKIVSVLGLHNVKQARELHKQRVSEAKYKALFNSSQDAIFLMKGETYVKCNNEAVKMFGCGRDDLLDVRPSKFSPEFQPNGEKTSEYGVKTRISAILEGTPQRFYWRHTKYDGTPFDVEVSLNKVEINGGSYHIAVLKKADDVFDK
jgi:PAS domain S-box-containing protein